LPCAPSSHKSSLRQRTSREDATSALRKRGVRLGQALIGRIVRVRTETPARAEHCVR
jgi:hypothetical protein